MDWQFYGNDKTDVALRQRRPFNPDAGGGSEKSRQPRVLPARR
jgi:hypothetical protein